MFDDSIVEIEGQSARRSVTLLDLPPVLQIQLQRVQYDREKGRIFKSNAHLKFPEEVNLGRYVEVDAGDEIGLGKKQRTNELRSLLEKTRTRLAKLEQVRISPSLSMLSSLSSNADIHPPYHTA